MSLYEAHINHEVIMIIGRSVEQEKLSKVFNSNESELLVVYGRRRVGKTFLLREYFAHKNCQFMHVTGVDKGSLKVQLNNFAKALSKTFFNDVSLQTPVSWNGAFELLNKQILAKKEQKKKIVIFMDELPWLATRRSRLLQVIDYYWNHHWSKRNDVILAVCGSSASWMIKNIIYNRGGLHNRVTCEICLLPFTLADTKKFLISRKIKLNNRHILTIYMALGGIPYYLKYIEPGLLAEENIQKIIFDSNAPLKDEFNKLFKSLFENSEAYIEIITLLATKRSGLTRSELQSQAKLSTNGGRLSERLKDLCRAGFIAEYIGWKKSRGEYYKLMDEFSLFYIRWVRGSTSKRFTKNHWINQAASQSYKSWTGYAFECTCSKHIDQIISALNITAGGTIDTWRFIPRKRTENGAQVDLLLDRNDNTITIFEIKYTDKIFVIDKAYAANLENKLGVFKEKNKN